MEAGFVIWTLNLSFDGGIPRRSTRCSHLMVCWKTRELRMSLGTGTVAIEQLRRERARLRQRIRRWQKQCDRDGSEPSGGGGGGASGM